MRAFLELGNFWGRPRSYKRSNAVLFGTVLPGLQCCSGPVTQIQFTILSDMLLVDVSLHDVGWL